jgi:hypothetical protein
MRKSLCLALLLALAACSSLPQGRNDGSCSSPGSYQCEIQQYMNT